jgi:hypothetical protein
MGIGTYFLGLLEKKQNEKTTSQMSIDKVLFPFDLMKLNEMIIKKISRKTVSTYKSLGYNTQSFDDMDVELSFNSFEIGVLLLFYKHDYDLLLPGNDKIFPPFVEKKSLSEIKALVEKLNYRYHNYVDRYFNESDLKNQNRWSPVDATYLMYYLSKYKK